MLDELDFGFGTHYPEYEGLLGLVQNVWGAIPRVAHVL